MRADPGSDHRPQWPLGVLIFLAGAVFMSVTTEMLPAGLLPSISRTLDVSPASVGLLSTGYALMVAIFAAPLGMATSRITRRRLLTAAMLGYVISNTIMAVSPTYPVAVVARLIGGVTHGIFWAMLAGYVARIVPAERVGRAVTLVFTGGTGAVLLGVPAGTTIGVAIGWRASFLLLAGAALIMALIASRLLPDLPGTAGTAAMPWRQLAQLPGLAPLAVATAVIMLGDFAFFTYIAPYLMHVGVAEESIGPALLGYGLVGAVGLFIGGLFIDRRLRGALLVAAGALAAAFVALTFGHGLTTAIIIGTGLTSAAMGTLPVALQAAILRVAPDASDAASAINASAFNVGIAGGGLLGGVALSHWGAGALPVVAAVLTCAGVVILVASRRIGQRMPTADAVPAPALAGVSSAAVSSAAVEPGPR